MILVDTSVWIDHLDSGDAQLASLLEQEQVMVHPYVIGEIALGNLRDREIVLGALMDLPCANVATVEETLYLIDQPAIFSRGIGYVDISLIASAKLTPGVRIWTRDKRLKSVADELGVSAILGH